MTLATHSRSENVGQIRIRQAETTTLQLTKTINIYKWIIAHIEAPTLLSSIVITPAQRVKTQNWPEMLSFDVNDRRLSQSQKGFDHVTLSASGGWPLPQIVITQPLQAFTTCTLIKCFEQSAIEFVLLPTLHVLYTQYHCRYEFFVV